MSGANGAPPPYRVAINDFIAGRGISGSSRAARLITNALREGGEVTEIACGSESRHRAIRLLRMLSWDLVEAPLRARKEGAGLVVHPTNTGLGLGLPAIVVLHDLMVLQHKQHFDAGFRLYASLVFRLSARRAALVVTPSEHTARQASRWLPKANVRVIPWPAEQIVDEPRRYPDSREVLVVASADKHKRLPMAIEAVEDARHQTGEDLRLTLVARGGNDESALERALQTGDRHRWVRLARGLSDEELTSKYESVLCLLSSSLDEGFGLPLLEAAARATPVVHTGRGAMSEVVPLPATAPGSHRHDGPALTHGLVRLLDREYWEAESARSLEASRRFDWATFTARWHSVVLEHLRGHAPNRRL